MDSTGVVVRTLKAPAKAGVNRVWWNLRFDQTKEARLRTSPLHAAWLPVGIEGRTAPGVGRHAILAPPGTYTVKLAVGNPKVGATREFTQSLVVRKDPYTSGRETDIRAQTELLRTIQSDINDAVEMINTVETARGQLAGLKAALGSDSLRADVRASADSLDRKLVAAEERLFQMRVTGRGQDLLRWPMRLAEQLIYLAQSVESSDAAPTEQHREVQRLLHEEARAARVKVDDVLKKDVAQFNEMLRSKNLQNIIVTAEAR
jgi:hypothetical protein